MYGWATFLACLPDLQEKNLFQVVVVKIIGGVIKQTILNEKEINNINLIILSFYKLYYVLKKFKV